MKQGTKNFQNTVANAQAEKKFIDDLCFSCSSHSSGHLFVLVCDFGLCMFVISCLTEHSESAEHPSFRKVTPKIFRRK